MPGRSPVWAMARTVLVILVLVIAVFPLYWMLVTALTSDHNLFSEGGQFFPDFGRIDVFGSALNGQGIPGFSGGVGVWLLNSFLVAGGTCVVSVGLGIPFAYALSRFSFRGKSFVIVALFLTQMLPEALLVVPMFGLFKSLGLLGSRFGLALVDSAFVLPIVAFILKGAIDGIPRSIEEAARMDGCRSMTTLTRINIPLIAPSIAATAVIAFFFGWNEYVFAVTFIFDDAKKPASVGLASFVGELSTPLQTVMAVAFIFTIPAVVFYLFAQRYVVSGMTAGSIKG